MLKLFFLLKNNSNKNKINIIIIKKYKKEKIIKKELVEGEGLPPLATMGGQIRPTRGGPDFGHQVGGEERTTTWPFLATGDRKWVTKLCPLLRHTCEEGATHVVVEFSHPCGG